MTARELKKVKFVKYIHLNAGEWHYTTYKSLGITPWIAICVHSRQDDNGDWIVEATHYMVKGLTYDTKRKFLRATKDITFKPIEQ